jgi:hypothetical protein
MRWSLSTLAASQTLTARNWPPTPPIVLLRVESGQLSQRVNLLLALGGTFAPAPSGATETR